MRTTQKKLDFLVEYLNRATDSPAEAYAPERDAEGRLVPLAGHWMLDSTGPGYRLERMSPYGGTHCPFGYKRMQAGEMARHLLAILCTLDLVASGRIAMRKGKGEA